VVGAIQTLTDNATEASRTVCELCSKPGVVMEGYLRVKTLGARCGLAEGLLPVEVRPREEPW